MVKPLDGLRSLNRRDSAIRRVHGGPWQTSQGLFSCSKHRTVKRRPTFRFSIFVSEFYFRCFYLSFVGTHFRNYVLYVRPKDKYAAFRQSSRSGPIPSSIQRPPRTRNLNVYLGPTNESTPTLHHRVKYETCQVKELPWLPETLRLRPSPMSISRGEGHGEDCRIVEIFLQTSNLSSRYIQRTLGSRTLNNYKKEKLGGL